MANIGEKMKFIQNPLATVMINNTTYLFQMEPNQGGKLKVLITVVIPNDYSNTAISSLFPEEQDILADYESELRDDPIEAVFDLANIYLGYSERVAGHSLVFNSDYFYVSEGEAYAIDNINTVTGRTNVCGDSYRDIKKRYPQAQLVHYSVLEENTKKKYIKAYATPITATQFCDALNCLPPLQWHRSYGSESFKMSEFLTGDITAIYVRRGDEYFTFNDHYSLKHHECLKRTEAVGPFRMDELPDEAYIPHPKHRNTIAKIRKGRPGVEKVRSIHLLKVLNVDAGANTRQIAAMCAGAFNGWFHPSVALAARNF